jgi:DNA-binding beta-propeller fold protein YncE
MAVANETSPTIPDGAACQADPRRRHTHRLVAEIPTGLGPEGAVIDARRERAYVTSSRSHEVTILDLARNKIAGRLPVGREPTDIVLDEDRRRLFVCDLRSSCVTSSISSAPLLRCGCRGIHPRSRSTRGPVGCIAAAPRGQLWP